MFKKQHNELPIHFTWNHQLLHLLYRYTHTQSLVWLVGLLPIHLKISCEPHDSSPLNTSAYISAKNKDSLLYHYSTIVMPTKINTNATPLCDKNFVLSLPQTIFYGYRVRILFFLLGAKTQNQKSVYFSIQDSISVHSLHLVVTPD